MQIFISNQNLYWMNSMVRRDTNTFHFFFTHSLQKEHFLSFVPMMLPGSFYLVSQVSISLFFFCDVAEEFIGPTPAQFD